MQSITDHTIGTASHALTPARKDAALFEALFLAAAHAICCLAVAATIMKRWQKGWQYKEGCGRRLRLKVSYHGRCVLCWCG